ncbi:MAG TPA: hypothetical protein VFS23_06820, partial [Vicinamibacterales bacterium]|nr:hypothetical protein [Vicinamibacterales bacterium]
ANSVTHAPGDARALAERMIELATDAALRDRLGVSGRATAGRCFARSRMVVELTPIYRALMHA